MPLNPSVKVAFGFLILPSITSAIIKNLHRTGSKTFRSSTQSNLIYVDVERIENFKEPNSFIY